MYVEKLELHENRSYPLLLGSIYAAIAEEYHIPEIKLLLQSLKNDVAWPKSDYEYQVYFLDDLMKSSDVTLFQVRFKSSASSRDFVSIFLSVYDNASIKHCSIQFPGRNGRMTFSKCLEKVKFVTKTLGMHTTELDFEASGFPEALNRSGAVDWMKEHSLSAFVWHEDGPTRRYFHVRENPDLIREKQR